MVYEKSLPRSELDIMKALWTLDGAASASMLHAHMKKDWKIQTLITHLSRMVAKGVVICEHRAGGKGPRYFYMPAMMIEEYIHREIVSIAQYLLEGNAHAFMDAIYASGCASKETAAYLLEKYR